MPSPAIWAKIIFRISEDEFLCPVAQVKEYLARIKNKKQRSDKLLVTRKMGPAVSLSIVVVANGLRRHSP